MNLLNNSLRVGGGLVSNNTFVVTGGGLAARRLTALFERARFSPREVDAAMKAEAIEAIESLQDDLAATEAAEAA